MEGLALESNAFFMGIEYLAVFCSGLMGGLCAVRKNYDLFAMLITAWLTALGGGIIRDVMLGSLPPVGISDRGFVLTALVSGLAIAVIHPEVDKLRWSMLTIDALAVGLFAVNGTSKALDLGTSGMTAVFMGMFTALGGGLVRDMLLNDVPMIIRDKHLYAVPSAVGCVLTVFVCRGVQWKMLDSRPRWCSTARSSCWSWSCVCCRSSSASCFPVRSSGTTRIFPASRGI